MENASVTNGKYCSIAVISVPKAFKKMPETASMMLVTMDATQFTILSKIQLKSNDAHLLAAGHRGVVHYPLYMPPWIKGCRYATAKPSVLSTSHVTMIRFSQLVASSTAR